jgi:hypothetical protein
MPEYKFVISNGDTENPVIFGEGTADDPWTAYTTALQNWSASLEPYDGIAPSDVPEEGQATVNASILFMQGFPPDEAAQIAMSTFAGIEAGDEAASELFQLAPGLAIQQFVNAETTA